MKDLLYKELKLSSHPTVFMFPAFALMLLIPSYPYYVAFIYTCLSIFFVFMTGRENKDVFFTVSLPVRKRDIVKARCYTMVIIEAVQILISIPFAIIGNRINPNQLGNLAGIEANVAFYGFVFIMYGIFNIMFLLLFYKDAYRVGRAFAVAGITMSVYIILMELFVQVVPIMKFNLDSSEPHVMMKQIPILIAGILIYVVFMAFAYKRAADEFERVDL